MLKREDNELLTRVGPGTPMGEMIREFWMPACRGASLEAGGAPQRVRLVGEDFVAFRGADGSVGFMDERCPHRSASMALARNEDNALRCIFHGWKINAEGKVLDTPCEPAHTREAFAKTLKVRAFPAREAGGMVWVYLGKKATPPRFADFDFNRLPESHVLARRAITHYNWLQGVEAHTDASHLGVLHSGWVNQQGRNMDLRLAVANVAPKMELDVVPYGLREGAVRDQGDGTNYSRIRQLALPFFTFIPNSGNQPGGNNAHSARATVPIDDDWDAEWYIDYDLDKPLTQEFIDFRVRGQAANPNNFAEDMGDETNLWHQDRKAMKEGHFSGLMRCVPFEDFIIQASMGSQVDRSVEQLGGADNFIVRVRRELLQGVRSYMETGVVPWQEGFDYASVRAIALIHPKEKDWRDCAPVTTILEKQMAAE